MKKNLLNILLGSVIGGVFLWLAIRNIELAELRQSLEMMTWQWVPFFLLVCFLSFVIRAERWKLLLETEKPDIKRRNLMLAILYGYMVNYAIPRLGEITRSIYVSKKEHLSGSNILGTVVLERVIDVLSIFLMLIVVTFFVISDRKTMDALFGPQTVVLLDEIRTPVGIAILVVVPIISLFLFWKAVKYLYRQKRKKDVEGEEVTGIFRIVFMFTDGLISIRKLKKWPLFTAYTILLWVVYVFLTFIPMYGFGIVTDYGLGIGSAFSVMVIATIGVMLPSPGAVGTYHWFVKQSLLVLFAVPAVTGVAYAIVSHAAMLISVLLFTLVVWIADFLKKQG
jgi:uncharacterized membrane protein YbhN (UPF0104 family)